MLHIHCQKCERGYDFTLKELNNRSEDIQCVCTNKLDVNVNELRALVDKIVTAQHQIKASSEQIESLLQKVEGVDT